MSFEPNNLFADKTQTCKIYINGVSTRLGITFIIYPTYFQIFYSLLLTH